LAKNWWANLTHFLVKPLVTLLQMLPAYFLGFVGFSVGIMKWH